MGEKLVDVPKKDKRKYRRARLKTLRAWVDVSRRIRDIEFTETVKRRLVDEVKDAVDAVVKVQREADHIDRTLNPKAKIKGPKLKEEEKKNLLKKQQGLRLQVKQMVDDLEETPERLRRTIEVIQRARRRPSRRRRNSSKPTSDSSSQSRRSTPIAACSSSILIQEGNIGLMKAVDKFGIAAATSSRRTRRGGSARRSPAQLPTRRARSASRST